MKVIKQSKRGILDILLLIYLVVTSIISMGVLLIFNCMLRDVIHELKTRNYKSIFDVVLLSLLLSAIVVLNISFVIMLVVIII